jgi:putative phage-type endonuclease
MMKSSTRSPEDRTAFLGGTDVSAIMGTNPYKTAMDVWLEKTGRRPPAEDNRFMEWGRRLEPVVAQAFSEKTGMALEKAGFIVGEPEYLCASPDYLTEDGIVEIKTAGSADGWGPHGSSIVPAHYRDQVLHYMGLSGRKKAWIAVLIGGNDFRWYRVEHDEDRIARIREKACRFWEENVLKDQPPEEEPEESRGSKIVWSSDLWVVLAAEEAVECNERYTKAKKRYDELCAILKGAIGDATEMWTPSARVRWSEGKLARKTDWEAVAREAGASQELIDRHTTEVRARRVFTVRRREPGAMQGDENVWS